MIDDNSPDGTGRVADALAAELAWVEVLHRPGKEGLGPAYIAGFRRALAAGAELVLEIDCDFSHDPSDVPRADRRLRGGADSRSARAGSRAAARSTGARGRTIVSRGGSLYARTILGVGVRDLTGGFKCFRRACSSRSISTRSPPRDTASRSRRPTAPCGPGFAVVEIPITFVDRRVGESKMDGSIVVEAMLQVPALRWRALRGALCSLRGLHLHFGCMDEVTDATFADEVLASDVPVIVEFGAPWCRPCKAIEPRSDRDRRRARAACGSSSSTSTRTSARRRATASSRSRR